MLLKDTKMSQISCYGSRCLVVGLFEDWVNPDVNSLFISGCGMVEGNPAYGRGKSEKPSVDGHFSLLPKDVEGQKNPLAGSIHRVIPSCFLLGHQGEEIQIPHSVTLGPLATWSRGTKPGLRAGLRRGECKGVLWVEGWPFGEDHLGRLSVRCSLWKSHQPWNGFSFMF